MTTEQMTTTAPADIATDTAEKGLLIAVLLLVLMGAAGMLFMV
jgi:hypothetical protein